jgi:hypothetical protein
MMSQCAAHNATRFMQIVNPRLDHVIADTPTASAVPLSEGAATSASMGQSLPNPRTHKSSRLDADVSHESDILSPNDEFRNDSEPPMVSTFEYDSLIFQEMQTAILSINETLAEYWLHTTSLRDENCGEIFVEDVVEHFIQRLNTVGDSARKLQLLKQLINGPLKISTIAKTFIDNSSTVGLEKTFERALLRATEYLKDVCFKQINVHKMHANAQQFHRDGITARTNLSSSVALDTFFRNISSLFESPPFRNTRSNARGGAFS